MTNAEDVKFALENFHIHKNKRKRIKDDILVINTRMQKTGGSIIRMPENPRDKTSFQIEMIQKKDVKKAQLTAVEEEIKLAERFFIWVNNKHGSDRMRMVIDKYVVKLPSNELESKYCYSDRQIRNIIAGMAEEFAKEA